MKKNEINAAAAWIPGKLLEAFFAELASLDISYCVMNNYEQMPSKIPSDVDIVIEPIWFNRLDQLMADFAKKHQVVITQKIWSGYQQYAYMLSPLKLSQRFQFQLDFFVDFNMPRLPRLLLSEQLLAGKKRYKCFYIPACDVEATFLLMRRMAKEDLSCSHLQKLKILIASDNLKIRKKWAAIFGEKWTLNLFDSIDQIDLERAREFLFVGKEFLEKVSSRNQSIGFKGRFIFSQINRVIERLRYPVGLVVVLMAPDGGGKTTIGDKVVARLSGSFHGVSRCYWRPRLLPAMGELLFWNPREEATTNPNPHSHPPQNCLKSLFRFFYYLLDFWLGYYVKVYPSKVTKKLIVFDRYYYDFLVDLHRYQIDIPPWIPRFLLPTIPKPDITIYLDADAAVLYKRKQEVELTELERQREIFLKLASEMSNASVVRTDRDIEEVVEDATSIILDKKSAMVWRRLNVSIERNHPRA